MAPKPTTPAKAAMPKATTGDALFDAFLASQGPETPRMRNTGPSDAGRVSSFRQKVLLGSKGCMYLDLEDLAKPYTNADFNAALTSFNKMMLAFMEKNGGAKPCAVFLWHLMTKVTDEAAWPDKDRCTHAEAMALWIRAQELGLKYDTAAELVYDFGIDDAKVLPLSQARAVMVLEQLREARASGQIASPGKRAATAPEDDGGAGPGGAETPNAKAAKVR